MNKVVIFSESAAALLQYTTTSITGSRKRRANIAGQARPDSQARWQLRRLAGVAKIVEKGKVSYHTMVPYYGGGPKDGQKEVSVHRATNNNKHYLRATIMPNASDDSVDHNDSVEVALVAAAASSVRERSDLSFSYALRKVFSRAVDRNEAQPLSFSSKPDNHKIEHVKIDGRTLTITSAAVKDEGQATVDGTYNMRKAKSAPPLLVEVHAKKKGIFGKRPVENALTRIIDRGYERELQQKTTFDGSTRCSTPDITYIVEVYRQGGVHLQDELPMQDKSNKRRLDTWMIALIVLVWCFLGLGAFASVFFLSDLIHKPENGLQFTPTTIYASPSSDDGTSITFYAMADAPYTDHERENTMPYQINNLSDSADFLVHLGDLQDAQVDKCREPAYQAAEDVLRQSRIPVFVIPGGKC